MGLHMQSKLTFVMSTSAKTDHKNLVQALDDLSLDVPAAPELVAHFMSRAITDDILPPAFLTSFPAGDAQGRLSLLPRISRLCRPSS